MTLLPDFHLEAIRSGRVVTPQVLRGMPALLLFHNHLTLGAVTEVQEAVRRDHQPADLPFLASVVDLHGVPRLMRSAAASAMGLGYRQGAARLTSAFEPADYVVILPDWTGTVTRAFDLQNVGHHPALVFVDDTGNIRDRYQGPAPGAAARRMLAERGVPPVHLPGFPQVP